MRLFKSLAVVIPVFLLSLSPVSGQEEGSGKDVSAKAVAVSEVEMGWTTQAVLSSYVGDSNAQGYIDLLIPLLQNDNGMIFLYPRLGLSSDVNPGYSMGLGARHYIPAIDAIIGGNVFYDRYDSPGGNFYNQLGLGVEVLTRWVDARFNYYIPDSSPNVIDKRSARTRSQSQSVSSAWGQPFATGYTIRQPLTTTTTTRTTTVNQLFERFEDTMQGFDAEVGVLTPWLEQYVALRWFAGYYNFNSSYGNDIGGVKGRVEVRFSQKLAIDATYYPDEEVTGSNWLFGIRMSIPIYMENLADGRSPFQGSFSGMFDGVNMGNRNRESAILRGGSASTSAYAPSPFAAMAPAPSFSSASRKGSSVKGRMTEQLLRLSGARTSQSGFIENLDKRDVKVDVDVDRVTRVVVVEDSIVFVSNARGLGTNPGTFERPLNTIQGGVNRASVLFANRGDVFVAGTGVNYVEDVTDAGSSVKIWGGARGFPVNGGRRFTYGSQPVLNGGFQVANIPLFSLSGFTIINGFGGNDGVNTTGVNNVTIMDNRIRGVGDDGIELNFTTNAVFNVTRNLVRNSGDRGLVVDIDVDNENINGVITANTFFNNGGDGIYLTARSGGTSVVNLTVTNNVSSGNDGSGFNTHFSTDGGAGLNPVINLNLVGNQFLNNGGDGINVDADSDSTGTFNYVIRDNFISGADGDGLNLSADANDPLVVINYIVANNTVTGAIADNALEIDANVGDDGGSVNFTIIGNTFLNPGTDGIDINVDAEDDGGTASFTFTGNRITGAGSNGIDINVDGDDSGSGFNLIMAYTNNMISGSGDDGLQISADLDGGDITTTLNGNVFLNNGGDSIDINIHDADDSTFSGTLNNTSSGAGSTFSLVADSDSTGTFILDGVAVDPSTDAPVSD